MLKQSLTAITLMSIILTSRADDDRARLASCAVAALYDAWVQGK